MTQMSDDGCRPGPRGVTKCSLLKSLNYSHTVKGVPQGG